MSWLLALIILSNINLFEATNGEVLPSAVVIGTVYCDTCFQEKISNTSHFISGASVAIECNATSSRPSFHEEVKTDEKGKFEANLPFSVTKQAKKIEGCAVKLINSSQPHCAVASSETSSSLHLKSRNPSTHVFSAGLLSFKPIKKPNLCDQTPEMNSFSKKLISAETSDPPVQDPQLSPSFPPSDEKYLPRLPPLPTLPPLPKLPPLPTLPGLPFYRPVPKKTPPRFRPGHGLLRPPPPSPPPPPPPESPYNYEYMPPFPYEPSPEFPGIPPPNPYSSKKTLP